jgi:hypothetical protein
MCRAYPVRRHAVDNTNQLEHAIGCGLSAPLQAASSSLVPTKPAAAMAGVSGWDTHHLNRHFMWGLMVLVTVHWGCIFPAATRKEFIEWPHPDSTPLVGAPMEAGATLAGAAAVREMVKQNLATDPGLFRGCSSPEQGLDVAVFKDPKSGLYYVVLYQRFDRCGGPYVRVLDKWYEYAVTAQGEVLGEAPPMAWKEPPPPSPRPAPPEQPPPPAASTPETNTGTPAPTPSPVPASPPAPEAAPSPASPPATSPSPGTPGQPHES